MKRKIVICHFSRISIAIQYTIDLQSKKIVCFVVFKLNNKNTFLKFLLVAINS